MNELLNVFTEDGKMILILQKGDGEILLWKIIMI